ncbi:uncharacterized protein LTR77_008711 [Saxophila tyrrhenica]|uniref:Uncharacterized protein n=1 Tax=Saxophila tyrrhenica TaxID=1690608 RepID=A0AAV9NZX6_9PEZI|nr:hypothetical protein LTR77_008711 [Saxophila tyrrhenica]
MASETTLPPPTKPASPPPHRLSIPFPERTVLLTTLSAGTGLALGLAHGSTESGLRFRAENAHRLPTSQTGWYLYHKSKNYHVILGGVKEGFKMAGKLGLWSAVFVVMEEGIDRGRAATVRGWRERVGRDLGRYGGDEGEEKVVPRDFVSTVLAGLGTAGAFSAWNGFPLPTAVRLAKMGAKVGLVFGLLQDGVSFARGRRLGYVEFVRKHAFGTSDDEGLRTGKGMAAG